MGIVARALLLLEDDLVVAVAIEVAERGVAGCIAGGRLQRDAVIREGWSTGGQREGGAGLALGDRHDGTDEVARLAFEARGGVDEPSRAGERRGVELHRADKGVGPGTEGTRLGDGAGGCGAIDVERNVGRVGGEQPPADEHTAVGLVNRRDAPGKAFEPGRGGGGMGKGGEEEGGEEGEGAHGGEGG